MLRFVDTGAFAGLAAIALAMSAQAEAQTLPQAIADAYATNPALAEARARQDAVAEAPEQARTAGRPEIGFDAGSQIGSSDSGSVSVAGTLPLWTGGRVATAVRAADADVLAGEARLRDIEMAVLEDVVAAFAEVLFAQEAQAIAEIGIERLDAQVNEAQVRFDLGDATLTDVARLQAQRADVASNLADAQAALARARASYRAVVGSEPGTLRASAATPASIPPDLKTARALADVANPQVLERLALSEAAQARIANARAQGAPSLGLTASGGQLTAFGSGGSSFLPDRFGTVGLIFRIPLSTGGLVSSRVREASALARAEDHAVDVARRAAARAVDNAWASLRGAEERLAIGEVGRAAADTALRGVRAEYELGLRSTLDLLIAEQSLRAAELGIARSRSDVMLAEAQLLRAVGALTIDAYLLAIVTYGSKVSK